MARSSSVGKEMPLSKNSSVEHSLPLCKIDVQEAHFPGRKCPLVFVWAPFLAHPPLNNSWQCSVWQRSSCLLLSCRHVLKKKKNPACLGLDCPLLNVARKPTCQPWMPSPHLGSPSRVACSWDERPRAPPLCSLVLEHFPPCYSQAKRVY